MIGHWLLTLTGEQEDRILTRPMSPFMYAREDGSGCVIGAALGVPYRNGNVALQRAADLLANLGIGSRYNLLHMRFGERVNQAIRNRILANRAWRTLAAGKPSVAALG